MKCQRAKLAISLFLDERLDPRQQARLNRHLEGCEDCSSYLSELREGLTQLRSMPMEEPSENFEWNLRRKLQESLVEQKLLERKTDRSAFWPRFAASAAATLVVCIGVGALWMSNFSGTTPQLQQQQQQFAAESDSQEDYIGPRNNTPQRLDSDIISGSRDVQTVGGAKRGTAPRLQETIQPADPNMRRPLEQNNNEDSLRDSLVIPEASRP